MPIILAVTVIHDVGSSHHPDFFQKVIPNFGPSPADISDTSRWILFMDFQNQIHPGSLVKTKRVNSLSQFYLGIFSFRVLSATEGLTFWVSPKQFYEGFTKVQKCVGCPSCCPG